VSNIVGHLLKGASEPVRQRAFEYWRTTITLIAAVNAF